MKKTIFITILGVQILLGCTSSDVIDESIQTNAIGFESVVGKPTRGIDDSSISGDLTTANLDELYIYGYYTPKDHPTNYIQIFHQEKLYKKDGVWTYDNTRYWVPDAIYNFYAYSCGDIKLNTDLGTPAMDLVNDPFRVLRISRYICDDNHQHDLIYAHKEGVTGKKAGEGNDRVSFDFNHILTKISAEFVSEFSSEYDVIVSNVEVRNIRNIGSYNPKGNDGYMWTDVERTASDKVVKLSIPANSKANGEETIKTGSAYVLPFNYSAADVYLSFDVVVTEKESGKSILSRHMSGTWSPNWTIGYNYNYRIKITGTAANLDKITFNDMNVNSWKGEGITDVNITFSVN